MVLIVALMAGLGVLSLSGQAHRQWTTEAVRFIELAHYARDESLLTGQARAIGLTRDAGYAFLERVYLDNQSVTWWVIERPPLRERSLASLRLEFRLFQGERRLPLDEQVDRPWIQFDSAGTLTPFLLEWHAPGRGAILRIIGAEGGSITWEPIP